MIGQVFSDYGSHAIIFDFILNKKTGTLIFQPAGRKLFMENGNLVFASSDNSKEHFSEILTEMGVLDAGTLADVKASLRRGESLGKKLKERNIASPKHLAQALKQQITNIVDRVIHTRDGECLVSEDSLPPRVPKLKIQVLALLIRSVTVSEASDFLKALPQDHLISKQANFEDVLGRLNYPKSYIDFINYIRDHDKILATDITERFGWDRHFTDGLIYIFKLLDIISFQVMEPAAESEEPLLFSDAHNSFFDMDIAEPAYRKWVATKNLTRILIVQRNWRAWKITALRQPRITPRQRS